MKQTLIKTLKYLNLYNMSKSFKDFIIDKAENKSIQKQKMLDFYRPLIKEGDLVFDIGASDGHKSEVFQELGAKVVAIEPLKQFINKMKKRFGDINKVTIINCGVGNQDRTGIIKVCNSPYFSSFSKEQIVALNSNEKTKNLEWIDEQEVKIKTIDTLISEFGKPDFCKIDVEGMEFEVFSGLNSPIKLISFEYNNLFKSKAVDCINLLEKLGDYEFNYTESEDMEFKLESWINGKELIEKFNGFKEELSYRDIYARLKGERKFNLLPLKKDSKIL